jgi:hypothetical protein
MRILDWNGTIMERGFMTLGWVDGSGKLVIYYQQILKLPV